MPVLRLPVDLADFSKVDKGMDVETVDYFSRYMAATALIVSIFREFILNNFLKIFRKINVTLPPVVTVSFSPIGSTIIIPIQIHAINDEFNLLKSSLILSHNEKEIEFYWRYTVPPRVKPSDSSPEWFSLNLSEKILKNSMHSVSLFFSDEQSAARNDQFTYDIFVREIGGAHQAAAFRALSLEQKSDYFQSSIINDSLKIDNFVRMISPHFKWREGQYTATLILEFDKRKKISKTFKFYIITSQEQTLRINISNRILNMFGVPLQFIGQEIKLID